MFWDEIQKDEENLPLSSRQPQCGASWLNELVVANKHENGNQTKNLLNPALRGHW